MTRMIDILEEYMTKKRYSYFRMDGSTNIADRRDMVNEFQVNDKIFAFLLSTRAGGLGVNLTAADTVIFYDNDWNPTMDAQATDRAHRIGQKKVVKVYRLITKNTIEERILKRAKQKQNVQTTVYSGGAFKADIFKPREVNDI
jgi:DNA helicase INO80